jgi:hypothetical protein
MRRRHVGCDIAKVISAVTTPSRENLTRHFSNCGGGRAPLYPDGLALSNASLPAVVSVSGKPHFAGQRQRRQSGTVKSDRQLAETKMRARIPRQFGAIRNP